MLAALFMIAWFLMTAAIAVFIAVGAIPGAQNLGDDDDRRISPIPAFVIGALLISAQAAIWVAFGLKYGGAW